MKEVCQLWFYVLAFLSYLSTAQEFDYCGLLPSFNEIEAGTLSRTTLTLGYSARKASLRRECPGGVEFESEFAPDTTVQAACQSTSNPLELRLLYNLTEFCFDEIRRRNTRSIQLDVGIGENDNSQFVRFVDVVDLERNGSIIADHITFRLDPVDNQGYCENLDEPYISVDGEDVVSLIDLGVTLYKVSLQALCPFGIQIQDALAPARMLENVCQFGGFPNEYRLRIKSIGFCIVSGSFAFGQGYNRNDTYDVLITREPPSAFWIFFDESSFSLEQPNIVGFTPITNRTLPSISQNIIIPQPILDLLGGLDTRNNTQDPTTPSTSRRSPSPSPDAPPTDEEILDLIINERDDRSPARRNTDIEEIAVRGLNQGNATLLAKAFQAATVVNGNTTELFEALSPRLNNENRQNTAAEALELGVANGIAPNMSQGIVDGLSNQPVGSRWMEAISRSISANNCEPTAELLIDVREQARNRDIEPDFLIAVAGQNSTLLRCLTDCTILPGFIPGGEVTQQIEILLEVGATRVYEDELADSGECNFDIGPVVDIPDQLENRLLVVCENEENANLRRVFIEVDDLCPNTPDSTEERLTILELGVDSTDITSVDPLSRFVIGASQS